MAVDASGNVYFAEQNNHIIRKINTSGYLSTVAGDRSPSFSGDGGAATAAAISYPSAIFFDASGNLIISDNGNGRIRKVNTSGIISTLAGNGGAGFSGDGGAATAAAYNNIAGAAYDASGNLLIADQNNYRIRMVNTSGIISTIAGTGAGGYTGDGGAATACTFYRPSGLAVYSGNIYVTDMGNSAIRLIGTVTVSHAPSFTAGVSQTLNVCNGSTTAINSQMAITDIDVSQTETWSVVSSPGHGSLTGFPRTATSTGGVVTPAGLSYVSTAGYAGSDSFRINISDGTNNASTLILVTVSPAPVAGTIAGPTHVCPTIWTTYSTTGASGGTWSTSNVSLAYADASHPAGIFSTGAGVVTISYTVANACGTSVATWPDTIIALPPMSTITGSPVIAPGSSVTFTSSISGGAWSSSAASVATVTAGGVVRGNAAGTAAIFYALTNTCGTTTAEYDITVGTVSSGTNIYNFAGSGAAGFSGDGGNATSATLSAPSGIFITSAGVLYFCDQANNRIRKISSGGIVTTVAGNGTAGATGDGGQATAATLNNPMGVTVDAAGNVYIADYNNARIRKVNTSGIMSTLAGTGTPGYSADGTAATGATIAMPTGVAADASGNVYFAEQNNHIIRKISATGTLSTIAGDRSPSFSGDGGAATAAAIAYPSAIFFDGSGNLIISDNGNGRIRKVSTTGIISTLAGNGGAGFSGDGGAATAASFNNIAGAAYDGVGNLLIADQNNFRIRMVTASGIVSTIAGTGTAGHTGDGGAATACTFYRPSGLAVYSGNIYVTDMGNNVIRLIGSVTTSHAPSFTNGASQTLNVCNGSTTAINSQLAITDVDVSQTETWAVVSSPAHGSLTGFPRTATSTGGVVTPAGLSYVSTAGYAGTDSCRISISDGTYSASTLIIITVSATPVAGTISGASSICPLAATTYTTTGTSGGTWSTSNTAIATVNGSGVVTGVTAGSVTVSYTVTNSCTTATATFAVTVNPLANAGSIT